MFNRPLTSAVMVEAALTGEAITNVGPMAKIVGAMVSEISRNSCILPRFKVDVEREFRETPFIFLPRFVAGT